MTDERQGLPSASGIARLAACPGSLKLCAGLPDRPTDDSDFGTKVHAYLAGTLKAEDCTPEELDIAESCEAIEQTVVKQWKLRNAIPDDAEPEIEVHRDNKRLWYEIDGKRVCSGLADVIYRYRRLALIIDYKTLPGDHKDAQDNLQLRCLAVLAAYDLGWLVSADVALIQPLVTHTPTVCHYDVDALIQARKELESILANANKPGAPLRTGPQCDFCRGKMICPALRQEQDMMLKLPDAANLSVLTDEDVAMARDVCGRLTKRIEEVKAEAFRRAEANPELWSKLGWEIREGAGKRSVDDIATVGERLNAKGVEWKDITAACSITIGNVEKLTRAATKEKGRGLKKQTDAILDGCCTVKKAAPSLRRIGQAEEESVGGSTERRQPCGEGEEMK